MSKNSETLQKPMCPVFGQCGGCEYQDISYHSELQKKEQILAEKMIKELKIDQTLIQSIIPSPQEYHYRHRLDLGLRKLKSGEVLIGFVNPETRKMIEVQECSIARKEVSDYIPRLREEALKILPPDYRRANLTVKTGDDSRVLWGGIGRKSHQLQEKDYLWTEIEGTRIHYSLDHFFQINHSILPGLFKILKQEICWDHHTVFLDLYGGAGLFSMILAPYVKKVLLIEESAASIKMANYNAKYLGYEHFEIVQASVENCLFELLGKYQTETCIAMVDPPRRGLAPTARSTLKEVQNLKQLIYLSCNPESLIEDLKDLTSVAWRIQKIFPIDFFPKTKHLEVLVFLEVEARRENKIL